MEYSLTNKFAGRKSIAFGIILILVLMNSPAYPEGRFTHPRMDAVLLELNNVFDNSDISTASQWGIDRGLRIKSGMVNVETVSAGNKPMPVSSIRKFGGYVDATWRNQHSAWLPISELAEMANSIDEDYYIRRPAEPYPDEVQSEAPFVTGVDEYHNAGYDGAGVVIGVIDMGYYQLTPAENNGDIPPDPDQRIDTDYTGEGMESGTLTHGTGCTEIAYDMAPGAFFRLYRISNSTHLGLAVDDGIANGVNVWSHSLGWYNRGWHDDSGEPCIVANLASDNNQIFCTSAGNRARAHWQGFFVDDDHDNLHEWSGGDEYNRTPEPGYYISNGGSFWLALQWNTDGADVDNYDLYLYDDENGGRLLASSENHGENNEFISYTNNSGNSEDYWVAVEYVSGDGAEFELFSNLTRGFEFITSASSISSPANATGANVLSAGAVEVDIFDQPRPDIMYYSSRGPSNDGAIRPLITGPTNCATFSSGSFGGTSCAAPNIAGAAAVRWDFEPNPSAEAVRNYLLETAQAYKDWGSPGNDNIYGFGGLFLDVPTEVTITMIPELTPPIEVPAGSSFFYTGILANNTGVSQLVDAGLLLRLPNGDIYGPIQRYNDVPLSPSEVITIENIEQDIPLFAPDGEYWYIAQCGEYPTTLIDADSFRFIVYHQAGGESSASEWGPTSWFKDDPVISPLAEEVTGNYPNPFNAATEIQFALPSGENVELTVYDILGRRLETLFKGYKSGGKHRIIWDASAYPSGVYFYKLAIGGQAHVDRMIVLK